MTLYLEILEGELKGTRTSVKDGLVIGRKEGHLTIRDSKLSAKHVKVEGRADGSFWLIDLGSSNGIKTGHGRVRELELVRGAAFTLGRTPFQVLEIDVAPKPSSNISEGTAVVESDKPDGAEAAVAMTATRNHWNHLQDLAARASQESRNLRTELVVCARPLRLEFTLGLQFGTVWDIGYGPRDVGSASVDLQLEDPELPEACFRLLPHAAGVVLENLAATQINGQIVESADLQDGDRIGLANTEILVTFGNEI